jgi:hypothetical protein
METNKTAGSWQKDFEKATSRKTRHTILSKINETFKTKEGLNTPFLWHILKGQPNFIGVIPQDYLCTLSILSYPVTLIVNLDLSTQTGSHWIGLSITSTQIEIYDSLAMNSKFWIHRPKFLLSFLKKFSASHKIFVTPQLQSPISYTCGFYCIFFLLARRFFTFKTCVRTFSANFIRNDEILLDLLSK